MQNHFQTSLELFSWIQIWALSYSRTFTELLWSQSYDKVIVLLKGKPQNEVKSDFHSGCLCTLLYPSSPPVPADEKHSPQHGAATTMLHCRDGIGLGMNDTWFSSNLTPSIDHICIIRPQTYFSKNPSGAFWSFLGRLQYFTKEWLPDSSLAYSPKWWIAIEIVFLLESSSLSTEEPPELWESDHQVMGHLPD